MSTVTVLSIINRLNILYLDARTEKALSLSRTLYDNIINAKRNVHVMDNDDETNRMEEKTQEATRTLRALRSRSMSQNRNGRG